MIGTQIDMRSRIDQTNRNVFQEKNRNRLRPGISRTARVIPERNDNNSVETGSLIVTHELNPRVEGSDNLHELDKNAAILVIDDNHFNLVAAKLLLGEFGLPCDIAISGPKGLRLVKLRL